MCIIHCLQRKFPNIDSSSVTTALLKSNESIPGLTNSNSLSAEKVNFTPQFNVSGGQIMAVRL